jgi:hypothetical protein
LEPPGLPRFCWITLVSAALIVGSGLYLWRAGAREGLPIKSEWLEQPSNDS